MRALSAVTAVHPNDRLFTAVLTARSRFTEAVRSYERALAEPATLPVREHAGGIFDQPASPELSTNSLDVLSQQKDEARDRLIAAQRQWGGRVAATRSQLTAGAVVGGRPTPRLEHRADRIRTDRRPNRSRG
ncbi:MAG: hypothetical protein R2706_01445 [Acidimicrobiales bacterium]